jgi:hypothetical protein
MTTKEAKSLQNEENKVRAQLKKWEPFTFGGYEWLVLDVQPDKALLLSKDCVEKRQYHLLYTDITWEYCTLRQYLNREFFGKFSTTDQHKILTTSNYNPNNPWYGTNGGSTTDDKIFLLSLDEVIECFGDSTAKEQLKNRPGNNRWINSVHFQKEITANMGNTPRLWWLRSPGIAVHAAGVNTGGIVSVYGSRVDNGYGGIRPAFWINLEY